MRSATRSVAYVSYWVEGLVAHAFLSFTFDDAPPLSISIETRPELGEDFDPLVYTDLPFEELPRRSLINGAAQAADGAPDFPQRIRVLLVTPRK